MRQITAFIVLPLIMTILGPVGLEALHQAEPDTLQHILKGLGGRPRQVQGEVRDLINRVVQAEPLKKTGITNVIC